MIDVPRRPVTAIPVPIVAKFLYSYIDDDLPKVTKVSQAWPTRVTLKAIWLSPARLTQGLGVKRVALSAKSNPGHHFAFIFNAVKKAMVEEVPRALARLSSSAAILDNRARPSAFLVFMSLK